MQMKMMFKRQSKIALSTLVIVTTLLLSLLFTGFIPGPIGRALSQAAGGWVELGR